MLIIEFMLTFKIFFLYLHFIIIIILFLFRCKICKRPSSCSNFSVLYDILNNNFDEEFLSEIH